MSKDYIVQKAVAPDKVVKANRRTVEQLQRTHWAQHKYDGCCAVINTSTMQGFSRTGEPILSMDDQIAALCDAVGTGYVIIAEAWWPGEGQFSEISGAFRKKSEQRPRLQFICNDMLTEAEFAAGESLRPYHARWDRLRKVPGITVAYTVFNNMYEAQPLCNNIVELGGYDGLILRDPEAGWKRGSGTEGGIIKIKRELSYDLRVTGVHEGVGEKTGRAVFTITVDFGGRDLGVGSGIPHDRMAVPKVGDIVEVVAMDKSSDGLLREPRYKGIRHDKLVPDQP